MTKAERKRANMLFLLRSSPITPEQLVGLVVRTRIRQVMLSYSLWQQDPAGYVRALQAAGIDVWLHLEPPRGDQEADREWLVTICQVVRTLGVAGVYADWCDYYRQGPGWVSGMARRNNSTADMVEYRQMLREALGPEGVLLSSAWMWQPEAIDGVCARHPRGDEWPQAAVVNGIFHALNWKVFFPYHRCEVGWIGPGYGTGSQNGSKPYATIPCQTEVWKQDDIRFAWNECRQAGLPITWICTTDWLAADPVRLADIGRLERLTQRTL